MRQRQENLTKFEATLVYIVSQAILGYIAWPYLKHRNKTKAKNKNECFPERLDMVKGGGGWEQVSCLFSLSTRVCVCVFVHVHEPAKHVWPVEVRACLVPETEVIGSCEPPVLCAWNQTRALGRSSKIFEPWVISPVPVPSLFTLSVYVMRIEPQGM